MRPLLPPLRDVCEPATLAAAVAAFGPIDVCIANAGVSGMMPLIEQDIADITRIFATNVVGVVATAGRAVND